MGYRCPNCKRDFGRDEEAFKDHFFESKICGAEYWAETELRENFIKKRDKEAARILRYERKYKINNFSISKDHIFKKTSLVTDEEGFDNVVCTKCGLVGKRSGDRFYFEPKTIKEVKKIESCD